MVWVIKCNNTKKQHDKKQQLKSKIQKSIGKKATFQKKQQYNIL